MYVFVYVFASTFQRSLTFVPYSWWQVTKMAFKMSFNTRDEDEAAPKEPQRKRTYGETSGSGSSNPWVTNEGVNVLEVIERHNEVINHLEMRVRYLENSTFITLKVPPTFEWVVKGKEGSTIHYNKVTKARSEGHSGAEMKKIGSACLYVAYEWLNLMYVTANYNDGEYIMGFTMAEDQLKQTMRQEMQNIHQMDRVFSHSQAWLTKDKSAGFIKYKFTPWCKDLEIWITNHLLAQPGVSLEGQPAPPGSLLWGMNEAMGLTGRGRKT